MSKPSRLTPRSPTTNCSPPSSPAWTARSTPPTAERRRLADLYQAGLIDTARTAPPLQRSRRRRTRPASQTRPLAAERTALAHGNLLRRRVTDFARPHPRSHRHNSTDPQKQHLLRLLDRRRPRHRLAGQDPAADTTRPATTRPSPAHRAQHANRATTTRARVKPRRFAFRRCDTL